MTPESQVNPVQTGAELAENWQQTGAEKAAVSGATPATIRPVRVPSPQRQCRAGGLAAQAR